MADTCETCVYCEKDEYTEDAAKCRRYPPVLITGIPEEYSEDITGAGVSQADFFSQPWVALWDWCGEYKRKL